MKTALAALLFVGLIPSLAASDPATVSSDDGWKSSRSVNAVYNYNKNGLLVQVGIVEDPQSFLKEWNNTPFDHVAVVKTRETPFHQGDVMFPAIMFATDALSTEGKANITADMLIRKPDGTVSESKGIVVCQSKPSNGLTLQAQCAAFRIENSDPVGLYKVMMKVTDHLKGVVIEAPLQFEVVATPADASLSSSPSPAPSVAP